MKTILTYEGKEVFKVLTNHSMTLDELIIFAGYTHNDNQQSNDDGEFIDNNGNEYFYDLFDMTRE